MEFKLITLQSLQQFIIEPALRAAYVERTEKTMRVACVLPIGIEEDSYTGSCVSPSREQQIGRETGSFGRPL